jgi:ankyrin repeat protein
MSNFIPYTPLINAIRENNVNRVRQLISKGSDVNEVDNYFRESPLYHAMILNGDGNVDIIRLLLEAPGINMNRIQGGDKTYLMHLAKMSQDSHSQDNTKQVIQLFIEKGADVNMVDSEGKTALIIAIKIYRPQNAIAFIESGADIHVTDNNGKNALWYAMLQDFRWNRRDSTRVVEMLIEKGADTNIVDSDGTTMLMLTLNEPHIIRILLDTNTMDVNRTNHQGKTALMFAMEYTGSYIDQSVIYLIDAGADVNTIVGQGRNVFMTALTKSPQEYFLRQLISRGADLDRVDDEGRTVLMLACMYCSDPEIINMLLERGGDINRVDNYGKSALILVASAEYYSGGNYYRYKNYVIEIILLLIERGALLSIVDNNSKTFFDYVNTDLLNPLSYRNPMFKEVRREWEREKLKVMILHTHESRKGVQPSAPHDVLYAPLRDYYDAITDERLADDLIKQSFGYLFPDGKAKKRSPKKKRSTLKNDGQKRRSHKKKKSQKRRTHKKTSLRK